MDKTDDARHVEDVLRHLRRHDVSVVAASGRNERVGLLNPRAPQRVFVGAVPDDLATAETIGKEAERGGVDVKDRHVMPFFIEHRRQG